MTVVPVKRVQKIKYNMGRLKQERKTLRRTASKQNAGPLSSREWKTRPAFVPTPSTGSTGGGKSAEGFVIDQFVYRRGFAAERA
jgi:hypothetical protein